MPSRPPPQALVAGRFQLEGRSDAGGMGDIYFARDLHSGAQVAVKFVRGGDVESAEQFAREASLLAVLSHPGIVRYVAHGSTPAGAHYLVMEWLEGDSLADRLLGTGLTLLETVTLGIRVADALGEAHRSGVVHRDVKPRNLILPGGEAARVKIIDFGVALRSSAMAEAERGLAVGTPGYMAPEQVRGEPDVDARADVFALGCVLWECLAGRPAFAGAEATVVHSRILFDDPVALPHPEEVPGALRALLSRMLAKDRTARPRDGSAVAAELGATAASIVARAADTFAESAPDAHRPDETGQTILQRPTALRAPTPGEGESPPPERSSRPTPLHDGRHLTGTERRILCAIAVRGPDVHADADAERERAVRDVVTRHGGTLDMRPDGTLLVTIGMQASAPDLAARAARTALGLREILPEHKVALVTGWGVLGESGATGDILDDAAAAVAAAADGTIRIDEVTATLLDAAFEVEGETGAFRLLGERVLVEPLRTLLGRQSSFVGRDREMATILSTWDECVSEPVARVVLVSGAEGAGKSRLRYEILRVLRERGESVEVLLGRGDPVRAGSPFSILGPVVRAAAGITPGEGAGIARRRLRARLGRSLSGESLLRAVDFLGEMAGLPFPPDAGPALRAARASPQTMADGIRSSWISWLEAECSRSPVLLVLEDLHHGDAPTVALVDAALRSLRDLPFFVLALVRPEIHALFPGIFADRDVQEIRLARLTRRASETLVREALGESVDPRTIGDLVERADGSPFFLEELVRAVAGGATEALPDTVVGTIQARLGRLGAPARKVLRAASVFGQTFWRGGVAALAGVDRAASVDEWLEELVKREIVARRPTSTLPRETEYAFRSTLLRDAAYTMLTDSDRPLGHALAAEWLRGAGETNPVVIADHLVRAADPAAAAGFWLRGAEQSLEQGDLTGALDRAGKAIDCGAAGADLGAALLVQADVHRWRGDFVEGLGTAEWAAAALPPGSATWLRAVENVVVVASRLGRVDLALEWIARACSAPRDAAAERPWIQFVCQAVLVQMFAGKTEEADALAPELARVRANLASFDDYTGARVEEAWALRSLMQGDLGEHLASFERAVALHLRVGDLRRTLAAQGNLGFSLVQVGDYDRAIALLDEVAEASAAAGLEGMQAAARVNLAGALAAKGWLKDARVAATAAQVHLARSGDARMLGGAHLRIAEVSLAEGDAASAEREARAACEVLKVAPPLRGWALATLARALVAQGRVDDALEAAREGLALADSLGGLEMGESLVRLVFAEVLLARGDSAGAGAAVRSARDHLLLRASKIGDPVVRERLLRAVPENARILEWARAEESPV